jgi:hypothetical protein
LAEVDRAPTPATLAAIADAAEKCLPYDRMGGALGLSPDEWRALVCENPEAVRLAIAKGRTAAFVANAEALQICGRHGKAEAALFILQRDHGWGAKPRRGRPPKSTGPADLPPP